MRWFIALGHVPRPPPVIVPLEAEGLVVLLCLVAILRDWRLSGKLHPAWLWGFGGVLTPSLPRGNLFAARVLPGHTAKVS